MPQIVKKASLAQRRRLPARREARMAYAFILPLFIILAVFMFYPLISGLAMSLQDQNRDFVGLRNFQLLLGETRFRENFLLSVIYVAVSVPLIICTGLLAAHLITQDSKAVKFLRPLYLIPWVIPPVASGILFSTLYDGNSGPIPQLVKAITGKTFMPLANAQYSIAAVISHEFWRSFPFAMLFLAAGLTTIPRDIYEAATIDGASKWTQFKCITLPLIKSHLFIVILMTTNSTLQSSEVIYSLTRGGPGYSTETIAVRMFKDAFVYFEVNTGAAISVFLLVIAMTLMVIYSRLMVAKEDGPGE